MSDKLIGGYMHVYFNNAATSFPKPEGVVAAVKGSLEDEPTDPGRGGRRGRGVLDECRELIAELFEADDPLRIALFPSATAALNAAILGLAEQESGHVVCSELEHNSVLRPLTHLQSRGHKVTFVAPTDGGLIEPSAFENAIASHTRFVCLTQASNVTGSIQPVEEIAEMLAPLGIPLVVDAAQSAGAVPLNHGALPGRVFVAVAGHKGLYGPSGTGALILPDGDLPQTVFGGTGVHSERVHHPPELPLRHEAGTPNLPGFAGLAAGLRFVRKRGVVRLGRHRQELVHRLCSRLADNPYLQLFKPAREDGRAGIVSLRHRSRTPAELAFALKDVFGIRTRDGLHCAPLAHRALGTEEQGTVRVSFSEFNTAAEVDVFIDAMVAMESG